MTHQELLSELQQYVVGKRCGLCGERGNKAITVVDFNAETILMMNMCRDCHEEIVVQDAEEIEG